MKQRWSALIIYASELISAESVWDLKPGSSPRVQIEDLYKKKM